MKWTLLTLLALCLACSAPPTETTSTDLDPINSADTTNEDTIVFSARPEPGYYVLSGYLDSVLANRAIAPYRINRPAFDAFLLKVGADSVTAYGLLHSTTTTALTSNPDSIFGLNRLAPARFHWYRNQLSIALNDSTYPTPADRPVYRLLGSNDQPLLDSIIANADAGRFGLSSFFHRYYFRTFMVGAYQYQGQPVDITEDGQITGFGGYHTIYFHDYFGTSHPFSNHDAIILRDTTFTPDPGDDSAWPFPFAARGTFRWQWHHDTLELTELLTDHGDSYRLGDRKWGLVRR